MNRKLFSESRIVNSKIVQNQSVLEIFFTLLRKSENMNQSEYSIIQICQTIILIESATRMQNFMNSSPPSSNPL
jgi:hypothetical protein